MGREDSMSQRDDDVRPDDGLTHAGFRRRLSRGIVTGIGAGLVGGAALGVVAGLICCNPPGRAFWMAVVAFVIAGVGVGTFVGGLSRLESPDPGSEPSDVARPISDEPGLTKEEKPVSPGAHEDPRAGGDATSDDSGRRSS
jgi:hypothetical protein